MFLTSVALTFIALAAAWQVQPATAAAGVVRVHSLVRQDGKQQVWEIDRNRLDALPAWTPNVGSLPFTAAQAVAAARTWLSRYHPDVKGWTEVETAMRRMPTGGRAAPALPNSWFYEVILEPGDRQPLAASAALADTGRFRVVVLFDGSVVDPKIADAPDVLTSSGPGTGIVPPRVLASPAPRYTPDAMRARIQGLVTVRCVVNTDGVCEDITVTQSLDKEHGLDEAAVDAARQWRFAPGTRAGQPVKVAIMIQLSFNLRDNRQ